FRREPIGKESLDDLFLPELLNRVAGKLAVEEIHRLGEVVIDGGAIAPVIELAESCEEVFCLFVFRFVGERFIRYGLCAADFIDSNYNRFEGFEGSNDLQ